VLLDFLRSPEAYRALGLQGQEVRTIETHHAWVFLFGNHALKLKKPVRTRWLDFSTPALRGAACRQELQLNQALAPGVYLGLVRACELSGGWHLQRDPAHAAADESTEDWLVLMRRLPEDRMLDHLIGRKALCPEAVDRLARVLCSFWSSAPKPSLAPGAWLERMHTALAQHAQALACQVPASPTLGGDPSALQIQLAVDGCQRLLQGCARDIEQRVTQGRMVCGHGDLRPEHVHLPERPGRPLVIDRLEFNDNLREVDPFEELSFLAVECRRLGAPGWADGSSRAAAACWATGRRTGCCASIRRSAPCCVPGCHWPICRTPPHATGGAGALWRPGTSSAPGWPRVCWPGLERPSTSAAPAPKPDGSGCDRVAHLLSNPWTDKEDAGPAQRPIW